MNFEDKWFLENLSNNDFKKADIFLSYINIKNNLLDLCCGAGILYKQLKNQVNYTGIDLSEKIVNNFKKHFPEAHIINKNVEAYFHLNKSFDFIVLYNSLPHITNYDTLFINVKNHLNSKGKFYFGHSKSRKKLINHRKKNGFSINPLPLPSNMKIKNLSKKYNMNLEFIVDNDIFSCLLVNN